MSRRGRGRPAGVPLNPMRPDSFVQERLALREIPPDPRMAMGLDPLEYLRCYRLGECSVIVTREFGEWHLSIAHPRRYPSWDEISQARYRILPRDIWVAMYLPPPEQYVNIHRNCFQLKECPDPHAGEAADAEARGVAGAQPDA